jgi:hypothetical protein
LREDVGMTDLPSDVRDRYRHHAQARRWPPELEAAFLRTVAWFREIDEGPGMRRYFERTDDEGLAEQGTRWLWETVIVNGTVTAVKQMETPLNGPVRRYWWRLTDQPLVPDEMELRSITREAFYQVWDQCHLP